MFRICVLALILNLASGQLFTIPNDLLQIPGDIFQDISNIVTGVINVVIPSCEEVKPEEVKYFLYTRDNREKAIVLNATNFKSHIKKAPIKMYIHGWISNAQTALSEDLKNAYLNRGDYNVILVDWETLASLNYAQSICSMRKISLIIGKFIFKLQSVGNVDLSNIHLIGHSLGAHLSGLVGQYIQSRTTGQKLYRITGLDAAGPGFLGFPKDTRLDASDALFVDAIHTNGAQFGYPVNYGSVDFYPNCGLIQPGCLSLDIVNFNFRDGNTTLLRQTSQRLGCSHNRSIKIFTESVNSKGFLGSSFRLCFLLYRCSSLFNFDPKIVMGEDVPLNAYGSYCFDTNGEAPYAKG